MSPLSTPPDSGGLDLLSSVSGSTMVKINPSSRSLVDMTIVGCCVVHVWTSISCAFAHLVCVFISSALPLSTGVSMSPLSMDLPSSVH
jgi:hypothetical protein